VAAHLHPVHRSRGEAALLLSTLSGEPDSCGLRLCGNTDLDQEPGKERAAQVTQGFSSRGVVPKGTRLHYNVHPGLTSWATIVSPFRLRVWQSAGCARGASPVTFRSWNLPPIAARPRLKRALRFVRTAALRRFESCLLTKMCRMYRRLHPVRRRKLVHRPTRYLPAQSGRRAARPTRPWDSPFNGSWRGRERCWPELGLRL